ncbi:DNA-binding transcriptional regulator [Bordetella ansorpii]|uniref:DNA-binding transcriptional regulator n=1 Tax=Bordetella ansorpii TaxID=288768 RepID=A0A157QP73_9BORD|nr:ogr/Delta-like zinc finger family protein [Bordetella ansorpii]SAI47571.1 DNA-binding transcriptional regulator [Bordetella ansorpii]
MNVLGMNCPHCETWATVRSSERVSATLRIVYFQCRELNCGHTWKAHIEAVMTITPSAMPRPGIELPISPHSENIRRAAAAKADPRQQQMSLDHADHA